MIYENSRSVLRSIWNSLFLMLPIMLCCISVSGTEPSRVLQPKRYAPPAASPNSRKGEELFKSHNCSVCHTTAEGGGCLGPPLNGVGARRSKEFILSRITDDKAERAKFGRLYDRELMPHVRLPKAQSAMIADYLLTLPEPKYGYKIVAHAEKSKPAFSSPPDEKPQTARTLTTTVTTTVKGMALLTAKGCMACHSLGKVGGQFAPPFDGIGSRKTKKQVEAQMSNAELLILNSDPEYAGRGTSMPPLDLSPRDIDELSTFLMSLK